MKRYKLYTQLSEYNEQISNNKYTHYTEGCNASDLIEVGKKIDAPCVIIDEFTGKIIWSKEVAF